MDWKWIDSSENVNTGASDSNIYWTCNVQCY